MKNNSIHPKNKPAKNSQFPAPNALTAELPISKRKARNQVKVHFKSQRGKAKAARVIRSKKTSSSNNFNRQELKQKPLRFVPYPGGNGNRDRLTRALLSAYCLMLVFACGVLLLQGFKVHGFALDAASLKFLGGVVVTPLAGLLKHVVRAVFKQR